LHACHNRMPFNNDLHDPIYNCELFAIKLNKAPSLLRRLLALIDSCEQAGAFHWWQRAGKSAEMTKETTGMFALEISTQ
jgi:hypothetical protein